MLKLRLHKYISSLVDHCPNMFDQQRATVQLDIAPTNVVLLHWTNKVCYIGTMLSQHRYAICAITNSHSNLYCMYILCNPCYLETRMNQEILIIHVID